MGRCPEPAVRSGQQRQGEGPAGLSEPCPCGGPSGSRRAMRFCIREGIDFSMEFRVPMPDGSVRWILDQGKTFRDEEDRPIYMTGACVDITERKRAEASQHLLLEELNHRVKNTLAMVQSIASQTFRSTGATAQFPEAFQARLQALAQAHDLL